LQPCPNKLVGARAIPSKKIDQYLLNLAHPEGAGKAKFFLGHGFSISEPETLAAAIHAHAEVNAIGEIVSGKHGTKTTVRCSIATPDGKNPCITVVWIRETGCDGQRLVTAYPHGKGLALS
jgi:hypothetical protein